MVTFDTPVSTGQATSVDVVVIGAGVAGVCVAAAVARDGRSVAIVDLHERHRPEFRAEKLNDYLDLFQSLGLGEAFLSATTMHEKVHVYRGGKFYKHLNKREFGCDYATLINALRDALPAGVTQAVGRVTAIETSVDRQRVTLMDGRVIEARLVVVATGLGDVVRQAIGARRVVTSKAHSLAFGFTLAGRAEDYPCESLIWYADGLTDKVAYVTLFRLGGRMRANMFTYHEQGEDWVKEFRAAPAEMLRAMMSPLADAWRGFEVEGMVSTRPVDLTESRDYLRDGVVFVGDAFRTTCPTPGVGFSRVLTDVDRLCNVHLPVWLATPGMPAKKIGAFYDDPVKREVDEKGAAVSVYARNLAVGRSLQWLFRRLRNKSVRSLVGAFGRRWRRFSGGAVEAVS